MSDDLPDSRPVPSAVPSAVPTDGFRASVERIDVGSWRVTVAGDLDSATSPELGAVLDPLVAAANCSIVMNLEGVTFMDSSGLRALVRCANDAAAQGGRLVLTRVSEPVTRLLEVTGLVEHLGSGAGSS